MSSQPKEDTDVQNELFNDISQKTEDEGNEDEGNEHEANEHEANEHEGNEHVGNEHYIHINNMYDNLNISHQVYSYHKKILYKELDKKQEKLSIKIEILRFKYAEYKKWSDFFNLMIIILSSTITLLQSVNAEMKINTYFFTLSQIGRAHV